VVVAAQSSAGAPLLPALFSRSSRSSEASARRREPERYAARRFSFTPIAALAKARENRLCGGVHYICRREAPRRECYGAASVRHGARKRPAPCRRKI